MKSFATTNWISKQISYQHYLRLSSIYASAFITGAQPKAETGHKMQSISVVFSTLHCEGHIAGSLNRAAVVWAVSCSAFGLFFIFFLVGNYIQTSADDVIISQLQAISQLFSSYPPSGEFC